MGYPSCSGSVDCDSYHRPHRRNRVYEGLVAHLDMSNVLSSRVQSTFDLLISRFGRKLAQSCCYLIRDLCRCPIMDAVRWYRLPAYRAFVVGLAVAMTAAVMFLLWAALDIGGSWVSLCVDDLGQLIAAWTAAVVCAVASRRVFTGRATWALFAASSFAWGVGQAVWCYFALVQNTPVPFPSLADAGFLTAVPLAVAALLVMPSGERSGADRFQGVFDGCIIATSLLFASWVTVLGPLYRTHQGGVLKQSVSLAYPMSDVVMVSLVIILIARGGRPVRVHLALVMAGVVAFAVADSSFTYLTEINSYSGGNMLDTGWVAGYLLIGLGALWALTCPVPTTTHTEATTVSLVAPYAPVLVVLAVTGVQLLRGQKMESVSWVIALALVLLVLGREALRSWDGYRRDRDDHRSGLEPAHLSGVESIPRWHEL